MFRIASFIHFCWSNRWIRFLLAAGIAFFVHVEIHEPRNDLDIFLSASRDLFDGKDIYAIHYFDGYHYYYSVFFATLIHPLTWLSAVDAKALWILMNVMMIIQIWRRMFSFIEAPWLKAEMRTLLGALVLIFCLRFLRGNLHLCQMTIVILFLSLESIYRFTRGHYIIGAILLSIAINFKILPIVLIPYFLWRAEFKGMLVTLFLIVGLLYLPSIWLGMEKNNQLLHSYFALINPAQDKHVLDVSETSFHSLTTFFAVYFTENPPEHQSLDQPRSLANLSVDQLHILVNVVRLILVLGTFWFLRSLPFQRSVSKEKTWWEISYVLLLIPLIFPHQQHYAFMLSMPAVAWILFRWIQEARIGRKNLLVFTSMLIVYLTFNLSLLLGVYIALYNHFKILTCGALLLMIVLALTPPRKPNPTLVTG